MKAWTKNAMVAIVESWEYPVFSNREVANNRDGAKGKKWGLEAGQSRDGNVGTHPFNGAERSQSRDRASGKVGIGRAEF